MQVSVSFINSLVQAAPPIVKIILFLFLTIFVGGVIMNYSFGLYYTCSNNVMYKPDNILDIFYIKSIAAANADYDYCYGIIPLNNCPDIYDENVCRILCGEGIWNSTGDETCYNGFLGWFTGSNLVDLASCREIRNTTIVESGDLTYEESCNLVSGLGIVNATAVARERGCAWIDYNNTILQERLSVYATVVPKENKETVRIDCAKGDNVSLFWANLDLLSWETAIAFMLITLFIGLFSMMKR